jgi:hypothetical protein
MKLMKFNKYDESTDEFETGKIVNCERDSSGLTTVYTGNGSWYFTLTDEEIQLIINAESV